MKRPLALLALLATAALTVTACGDPVVGSWKSQQAGACGAATTFTVQGDLTGAGDGCGCHFTFIIDETQPGTYDADVNFENGCLALDGHYTCTLRANNQELDCGILGNFDRSDSLT